LVAVISIEAAVTLQLCANGTESGFSDADVSKTVEADADHKSNLLSMHQATGLGICPSWVVDEARALLGLPTFFPFSGRWKATLLLCFESLLA